VRDLLEQTEALLLEIEAIRVRSRPK